MSIPKGVFTTYSYEQDPRWIAVDNYTLSHLHPETRPNHQALNDCLARSHAAGLPDIATHPVLSKTLAIQCKAGNVTHALEVGTLGGYTPLWLCSMNPKLRVTAIEVDPRHAEVARENLKVAGLADRVEVIVGSAVEVMPQLLKNIEDGKMERFGLTYIDADKINNWTYFDLAVKMSRPGAMIYVDNVVRRGRLVSKDHQNEQGVQGARLLVENVGKDKRVEAVVQQTVAMKTYDGYLMAVVN